MKDIESRSDVEKLVHTFYEKVRKDEAIGPVFNEVINDWPSHEEKLSDFWETNLFVKAKYKGNPVRKHQEVDAAIGGDIDQGHFFRWLQLWHQTIDELFEGNLALLAKTRARKMATHLFIRIFTARSDKSS